MAVGARGTKVPMLLLCTCITLCKLQNLISWVFKTMGLSAFMDADYSASNLRYLPRGPLGQVRSADLALKMMLPILKFNEVMVSSSVDGCAQDGCAVCLCEFEGEDEIRPLTGCRHIFHRKCLDRWMDLNHRTCPLCRTPLVSID